MPVSAIANKCVPNPGCRGPIGQQTAEAAAATGIKIKSIKQPCRVGEGTLGPAGDRANPQTMQPWPGLAASPYSVW
jgi:hypothetical protein